MTEPQPGGHRPPDSQVHLRDLETGDRVGLRRGGTAEVVMNPQDGLWVLVRFLEPPPGGPETAGEETMLYFEDVSGLIR